MGTMQSKSVEFESASITFKLCATSLTLTLGNKHTGSPVRISQLSIVLRVSITLSFSHGDNAHHCCCAPTASFSTPPCAYHTHPDSGSRRYVQIVTAYPLSGLACQPAGPRPALSAAPVPPLEVLHHRRQPRGERTESYCLRG